MAMFKRGREEENDKWRDLYLLRQNYGRVVTRLPSGDSLLSLERLATQLGRPQSCQFSKDSRCQILAGLEAKGGDGEDGEEKK